jgi:Ca2+-transporting ATPase
MEPREADVMHQPPRQRRERIISGDIFRNVLIVSVVMAVGTLWMFARAWGHGDIVKARTIGFTTMAMFQVFNALNCRSRTRSVLDLGLLSNRYLVAAIVTSVTLQLLANRLPLLQTILGTTPISLEEWLTIILVSSSVFVIDEVRKFVGRTDRAPSLAR